MSDMNDFNAQIIEEFRANDGVVGGPFAGATLVLLLHTTGAKSGTERVNPGRGPGGRGRPLRLRLEGGGADQSRLVPQPGGPSRR